MVAFENAVTINRPPDEVFAFVTDPANEPRWHTDVLVARRTSEGPIKKGSVVEFTVNFMGKKQIPLRVEEYVRGRRMVLAATAPGPLMPTFTYSCEPANGGTRFTRRGDIRLGGLMRLMEPMMGGMASRRAAGFLENLKRVLEA
jgi:uncharacterized protein YndB with AHSA1/START domain